MQFLPQSSFLAGFSIYLALCLLSYSQCNTCSCTLTIVLTIGLMSYLFQSSAYFFLPTCLLAPSWAGMHYNNYLARQRYNNHLYQTKKVKKLRNKVKECLTEILLLNGHGIVWKLVTYVMVKKTPISVYRFLSSPSNKNFKNAILSERPCIHLQLKCLNSYKT